MKGLWQTVVVVLCLITAMGLLQPIRGKSSAEAAQARDDVAAILPQTPLGSLLGKQVLIMPMPTGHEATQGKLEVYDANWVRIRSQDGSVRCYAAANILFISPQEASKP